MTDPVLPQASAAIHAAVYAARTRALGTEPASGRTEEKRERSNGNFVCSPFSILLVFAVAMRGARGRTAEEMERLLPLRDLPALLRLATYSSNTGSRRDGDVLSGDLEGEYEEDVVEGMKTELDVVSRMYVDEHLMSNKYFQTFKDVLLRECSCCDEQKQRLPVQSIDCGKADEAAREINAFVRDVTRGHITDLVSPQLITPSTRLLLVSAAFFRGPWRTPFRDDETEEAPFYALQYTCGDSPAETEAYEDEQSRVQKGEKERGDESHGTAHEGEPCLVKQNVSTMHVFLEPTDQFYFRVDAAVTAIGLPYADENYVMYVVQPNDPRDLGKLMRFNAGKSDTKRFPTLEDVVRSMRERRGERQGVEANVSLPKFALKVSENDLDLIPLFRRLLHISAPFDANGADFSGISGDHTLFMSAFLHQAGIEVDENGTVATAATMAGIVTTSLVLAQKTLDIIINKPFAFQLRYHPTEEPGSHQRHTLSDGGATTQGAAVLGDYVLFTGCVTDALAAQQ